MSAASDIRVLIVDDSAVSRKVLGDLIRDESDIDVVGSVADGRSAVEAAGRLKPNIILMDVLMPEMDGLSATRALMQEAPCPIVLVSELVGREADLNFRALEAGALDLMRKPTHEELSDGAARRRLLRKIRTYARVPVVRRHRRRADMPVPKRAERPAPAPRRTAPVAPTAPETCAVGHDGIGLICIGASTGGPPAVRHIVTAFGADSGWPIVIVQHMTEGFIQGTATWLASHLPGLTVGVARDGQALEPRHVYLAPDNAHLVLDGGRLRCREVIDGARHRPSVSAMFSSVATSAVAPRSIGILLTGMGNDGADGLLAMRQAGAFTIAQDESTSIVYGMPRAAAEMGAATEVLRLDDIAPRVDRYLAGATLEKSA